MERQTERRFGKMAVGATAIIAAQAGLGGEAMAAQDGLDMVPAEGFDGVVDVVVNSDGTATLTLSSGDVITVPAESVNVVDGVVMVDGAMVDGLIADLAPAAAGGGISSGMLTTALLSAVGVAVVVPALGSEDDDREIPTPEVPTAAPIFQSADTVSVAEGSTSVFTVEASDADSASITYGISGGADADLFSIDPETGALTFLASPDFEMPADEGGDNVYTLTVTATDGTNTTSQTINVTVTNVNEQPTIASAAAVTVDENETAVITVAGEDPDGDALTYSIVGGADAALFVIDAATGALAFAAAPDFEAPGDADGDNIYDVTVSVSDGTAAVEQALSVTVANTNDNAPSFTSSETEFEVLEDDATATGYVAAATDADGDEPTFTLGGDDAALFTIGAGGVLSFIAPPDFDDPRDSDGDNVYNVVITASDGENSTDQAVTVTVQQSGVPIFTSGRTATTGENTVATGYTAAATDTDTPSLTYAVAGGADAALFAIDPVTGVLSFVSGRDFESPTDADDDNVYEVTVSASDGENTATRAVSVTVTDEADEPPTFTSASAVSIAENRTETGYVAAASPDVDGDPVTYAIVGGADASLFTIDAATGALSFADAPSFEGPEDADGDNVYDVVVEADDGSNAATQAVSVTVTNVTEIFEIRGADRADFVGYSVTSIGDVDGDGRDDVAIGAILADFGDRNEAGETYIILSSTLAASDTNVIDLSDPSSIGVLIGGAAIGDESGYSVANAGDVDGDGLDDLIIGAHLADPNGLNAAGAAYVVFGATIRANQGGSIDLGALGDGGVVIQGAAPDDQAGFSVSSAGDVDDDGLADIIVSAPFADPFGNFGAGAAYVIFGSALAAEDDGLINLAGIGDQGIIINGIDGDDNLGYTVSTAGDVNGDGLDDVVIGARFGDPNGQAEAGESYVVFGAALSDDADGRIDLVALGDAGVRIDGIDAVDFSGWSVTSLGDLDGDGRDEVVIGAIIADPAGRTSAGETYVVFGSAIDGDDDGVVDLETLGAGGVRIDGASAFDESGFFVANAGDVDGDGIDDLIVTARIADPGGVDAAGSAYVVFGSAILNDADGVIDLEADLGTAVVRIDGVLAGDQLGVSAAGVGDVDGDGFDDIILGAPFDDDPEAGSDAEGAAYIISGAVIAGEAEGGDGIVSVAQTD